MPRKNQKNGGQSKQNEEVLKAELEALKKELSEKLCIISGLESTISTMQSQQKGEGSSRDASNNLESSQAIYLALAEQIETDLRSAMEKFHTDLTKRITNVRNHVTYNAQKIDLHSKEQEEISKKIANNKSNIRSLVNNYENVKKQTISIESKVEDIEKSMKTLDETSVVVPTQNVQAGRASSGAALVGSPNQNGQAETETEDSKINKSKIDGFLKALDSITEWEQGNLHFLTTERKQANYGGIRKKWKELDPSSEITPHLSFRASILAPSLEGTFIRLNPVVHAQLCDKITRDLNFECLTILPAGNHYDSHPFPVPNLNESFRTIRHLDMTVTDDSMILNEFIQSFTNIDTAILRTTKNSFPYFPVPKKVRFLRVIGNINEQDTEIMMEKFVESCIKEKDSTLSFCPIDLPAVKNHFKMMVNKFSTSFSFIELLVPRAKKPLYRKMTKGINSKKFVIKDQDVTTNNLQVTYHWISGEKDVQSASNGSSSSTAD